MVTKKHRKNLGIDIGGTKVYSAIVLSDGTILREHKKQFRNPFNDRDVLTDIEESITNLLTDEIESIGIGIPAIPDGISGKSTTKNCPNLKLLEHRDIKEYIENKYRIPVRLENDANCFIVGEHICGAGKNYSDCVGLTLGTGIGCGIILDGKLRRGSTWHCGEIFDIKLGNNLVLEDILSARYITEQTGTVDAKESAYLANSGDKKSISVWNEYGKWLGWIISVINRVIDPEIFILGGSLSLSYNLFYKEMRRNIDNIKTKIVVSKLKEKSAVIGASLIK